MQTAHPSRLKPLSGEFHLTSVDQPVKGGVDQDSKSGRGRPLRGWKQISIYLEVSIKAAQDWEKKRGMPVQRELSKPLAYTGDLDAWRENRRVLKYPSEGFANTSIASDPGMLSWRNLKWFAAITAVVGLAILARFASWDTGPQQSYPSPPVISADAKTAFRSAYEALEAEDYGKVVELTSRAIRNYPSNPEFRDLRGQAFIKSGKFPQAIDEFNEAIRQKADTTLAYYRRAECYMAIGQNEKAINDLNVAISLSPNGKQRDLFYHQLGIAHQNLGKIFGGRAHFEEAAAYFTKALDLNPKNGFSYHRRGAVQMDLGQREKALADYNSAEPLLPENQLHWLYRDRSQVKKLLGDVSGAAADSELERRFGTEK